MSKDFEDFKWITPTELKNFDHIEGMEQEVELGFTNNQLRPQIFLFTPPIYALMDKDYNIACAGSIGVAALLGIVILCEVPRIQQEEKKAEARRTIRSIEPTTDLDQNGISDYIAVFENGYRQPLFHINGDYKSYSATEMQAHNPAIDYSGIEQQLNAIQK